MPSPNATPTPITPPRVPLIDPRTGLIDRAWYLFFLSLNNIAANVVDDIVGPSAESLLASYDAALMSVNQELQTQPSMSAVEAQVAELQKQIEALQVQPIVDVSSINLAIASLLSVPVTVTADFTVGTGAWYINNKSGSTCTATLPTASTWPGRVLYFQNYQAQTLVSASSNVVPLVGGAAGTAILAAVAGDTATLVSDGSNWIMTQYVPNNVLLLE